MPIDWFPIGTRALKKTLYCIAIGIDKISQWLYNTSMNNELIFDEDLGEWIDPEAIRAEGEALETAARWEAADLAEAQRTEALIEEGDWL